MGYLRMQGIVDAAAELMAEWEASFKDEDGLSRRTTINVMMGNLRRDLWEMGKVTLDPMLVCRESSDRDMLAARARLVERLAEQRKQTPRKWREFARNDIDRLRAIAYTLRIRAFYATIPERIEAPRQLTLIDV